MRPRTCAPRALAVAAVVATTACTAGDAVAPTTPAASPSRTISLGMPDVRLGGAIFRLVSADTVVASTEGTGLTNCYERDDGRYVYRLHVDQALADAARAAIDGGGRAVISAAHLYGFKGQPYLEYEAQVDFFLDGVRARSYTSRDSRGASPEVAEVERRVDEWNLLWIEAEKLRAGSVIEVVMTATVKAEKIVLTNACVTVPGGRVNWSGDGVVLSLSY